MPKYYIASRYITTDEGPFEFSCLTAAKQYVGVEKGLADIYIYDENMRLLSECPCCMGKWYNLRFVVKDAEGKEISRHEQKHLAEAEIADLTKDERNKGKSYTIERLDFNKI